MFKGLSSFSGSPTDCNRGNALFILQKQRYRFLSFGSLAPSCSDVLTHRGLGAFEVRFISWSDGKGLASPHLLRGDDNTSGSEGEIPAQPSLLGKLLHLEAVEP